MNTNTRKDCSCNEWCYIIGIVAFIIVVFLAGFSIGSDYQHLRDIDRRAAQMSYQSNFRLPDKNFSDTWKLATCSVRTNDGMPYDILGQMDRRRCGELMILFTNPLTP